MLRAWQSPLNFFYRNPVKENVRLLFEIIFDLSGIVVLYELDLWLDMTISAVSASIHIDNKLWATSNAVSNYQHVENFHTPCNILLTMHFFLCTV